MARAKVKFDIDAAEYLGDGDRGVYWCAGEYPRGGPEHFVTVVAEEEDIADVIARDVGPFDSSDEAWNAGEEIAIEWCQNNHIDYD